MTAVQVLTGTPDDRPAGFPCFGCGAQVREERLVEVSWPDARRTVEVVCASCAPRYPQPRDDRTSRDQIGDAGASSATSAEVGH